MMPPKWGKFTGGRFDCYSCDRPLIGSIVITSDPLGSAWHRECFSDYLESEGRPRLAPVPAGKHTHTIILPPRKKRR